MVDCTHRCQSAPIGSPATSIEIWPRSADSPSHERLDIDDIMHQFEQLQLADPGHAEKIILESGYSDTSTTDSLLAKCPDHLLARDIDEGADV